MTAKIGTDGVGDFETMRRGAEEKARFRYRSLGLSAEAAKEDSLEFS